MLSSCTYRDLIQLLLGLYFFFIVFLYCYQVQVHPPLQCTVKLLLSISAVLIKNVEPHVIVQVIFYHYIQWVIFNFFHLNFYCIFRTVIVLFLLKLYISLFIWFFFFFFPPGCFLFEWFDYPEMLWWPAFSCFGVPCFHGKNIFSSKYSGISGIWVRCFKDLKWVSFM